MHYTGIGSRETPSSVLDLMTRLAVALQAQGWILRSGGADGADSAFEKGAGELKEIFLPWANFNQNLSHLYQVSEAALKLAETVHPTWLKLPPSVKKLHGRNMYQVLGATLHEPSNLVICWTKDGCISEKTRNKETGGTASAIVLADRHQIPVFNLQNKASLEKLSDWLEQQGILEFKAELAQARGSFQSSLF